MFLHLAHLIIKLYVMSVGTQDGDKNEWWVEEANIYFDFISSAPV